MSIPNSSPRQRNRPSRSALSLLAAALAAGSCLMPALMAADIFREAEEAEDSNMTTTGAFQPQTPEQAARLSGQKWFNGKISGEEPLYAEYEISVPEAGTYNLFIRKYWQHGAFRWRINQSEWQDVPKGGLLDSVTMREYVPLNWVSLGSLPLSAGVSHLRFEVTRSDPNTSSDAYGFDCLLLTTSDLGDYLQTHPDIGGELK